MGSVCNLEQLPGHSGMLFNEVFGLSCSLLDYVIRAFEFAIRSILSLVPYGERDSLSVCRLQKACLLCAFLNPNTL